MCFIPGSFTSIICARERSLVLVNVKDLQRVLVKRLGGRAIEHSNRGF